MNKKNVELENSKKPKYKICEECGESVKVQGYGGHLFLKHNIKTGIAARLDEIQGRLDEIENADDNSKQDLELEKHSKIINDLNKNLKSAQKQIVVLENFIDLIKCDPDEKTLWMEEKEWNEFWGIEKEEDQTQDQDNKKNPGSNKKEKLSNRIVKFFGIFNPEE